MLNYQRVYSWQVHQSFSSYVFSQFTIRQLNAIAHTFPRSVSWSRNSTQSSKRKDHQDHLASVYLMVLYEFTVYICVCMYHVCVYICIHIYIHTVYCVYIYKVYVYLYLVLYTCTSFLSIQDSTHICPVRPKAPTDFAHRGGEEFLQPHGCGM